MPPEMRWPLQQPDVVERRANNSTGCPAIAVNKNSRNIFAVGDFYLNIAMTFLWHWGGVA